MIFVFAALHAPCRTCNDFGPGRENVFIRNVVPCQRWTVNLARQPIRKELGIRWAESEPGRQGDLGGPHPGSHFFMGMVRRLPNGMTC